MRVWWTAPDDTGAGVGNVYPLLKYQVVLQQTAIAANPLAATSLVKLLDASVNETEFSMLQKGVQGMRLTNGNLSILVQFDRPSNTGAGAGQPWPLLGYECLEDSQASAAHLWPCCQYQ